MIGSTSRSGPSRASTPSAEKADVVPAVAIEVRGPVLWIHLQRPRVLNAINEEMVRLLDEALDRARASNVRAVVIRGTGRAFCAGADLVDVPGAEPDIGQVEETVSRVAEMVARLAALPKPVIAGINGICAAGGLEIALACDLIVAAQSARFADAHSNYGLLPGAGGSARLPRALGLPLARRMMFTGEFLTAEDLMPSGFVSAVVPDDLLDARLGELSADLARRSPRVLSAMKSLLSTACETSLDKALGAEAAALGQYLRTEDFLVGIEAFRKGERPVFAD